MPMKYSLYLEEVSKKFIRMKENITLNDKMENDDL